MSIISLENVSLRYGQLSVLKNISLDIKRGEFVSIVGPSGCGKSSLLRLIGKIENPTTGTVSVHETSVHSKTRCSAFGFVFQNSTLLPWRNVFENITLPLEILSLPINKKGVLKSIELALLKGFDRYYPSELSGGMQQKVAIARALIHNPQVIIMDEPFGAIDELQTQSLLSDLLTIWKDTQKTFIYVTHSIREAVYLSDRVIVLSKIPSHIKHIVPIQIPRPRPKLIEELPQYHNYIVCIRNYL
jgi:NitT/TauT family transport system ATP-binding protein